VSTGWPRRSIDALLPDGVAVLGSWASSRSLLLVGSVGRGQGWNEVESRSDAGGGLDAGRPGRHILRNREDSSSSSYGRKGTGVGEIERIKIDAIDYVDKMFQRPINRNNDLVAFTRFNANVEDALRYLSRGELMDLVRDLAFDFAIAGRWDRHQSARPEDSPGSEASPLIPFWPVDRS